MGCLRRLFFLGVLIAAVAAGWYLRDRWRGPSPTEPRIARSAGPEWQSLSDAGAGRTDAAIRSLGRSGGPVFVRLEPGDLASYVLVRLVDELPPSADSVQAAVIEDMLHVRASVKLSDLGGEDVLGPLSGLLAERETMQFGGVFEVIRPGVAQYRVKELRLRQFAVPPRLIPRIIARIRRGSKVEGLAADALPLEVPDYLADVRIADGRVTLYKNVP